MISFILSYIWHKTLRETELKTIKEKEKKREYRIIPQTCDMCGQQYYWCICDYNLLPIQSYSEYLNNP